MNDPTAFVAAFGEISLLLELRPAHREEKLEIDRRLPEGPGGIEISIRRS